MPELPEVETICRGIASAIIDKKITSVDLNFPKLRWPVPKNLNQILACQKFNKIIRRSKYLLLTTKDGTLILHLGMSGKLVISAEAKKPEKHEHFRINFADGAILSFIDPRRFGAILWTDTNPFEHKLLKPLGPEPLTKDFSNSYLYVQAQRHKQAIKQFIMNSKIVVGVGNIYANEALFLAAINPHTPANKVTKTQYKILVTKLKNILAQAIKKGGTTIRDYATSEGKSGGFQNNLKVYGRTGEKCFVCKAIIQQTRQGQRSTFYCPRCQGVKTLKHNS